MIKQLLNYNQIMLNNGYNIVKIETGSNAYREWISTYYKKDGYTAYYETGRDLLIIRKRFELNNKIVYKVIYEGCLLYSISGV